MKKINLFLLSFVFASLLSLGFVSADAGDFDCGMFGSMGRMMSGTYGFGMGLFGWLTGLLIVAILILLIVWLVKQVQKK